MECVLLQDRAKSTQSFNECIFEQCHIPTRDETFPMKCTTLFGDRRSQNRQIISCSRSPVPSIHPFVFRSIRLGQDWTGCRPFPALFFASDAMRLDSATVSTLCSKLSVSRAAPATCRLAGPTPQCLSGRSRTSILVRLSGLKLTRWMLIHRRHNWPRRSRQGTFSTAHLPHPDTEKYRRPP